MENVHNYSVPDGVFLTLLNRFKSKDDSWGWLHKPFNVGDKTVSTDACILISTPLQDGFIDLSDKTKGVYPLPFIIEKKISVFELKQKLNNFPRIDCYDEEEKECDACAGSCMVIFVFMHDFEEYESISDCPVCEGCGTIAKAAKKPNGKTEFDYNKVFRVGDSFFSASRINELLEVAEILKSDEILLVNQTKPNSASLFQIKNVEVLLMPVACSLCDVAQSILYYSNS